VFRKPIAMTLLSISVCELACAQNAAASLEEVVITASKKGHGESIQDVPFAVTAFSGTQLEAMNFRNLTSLSYAIPNVQLDSNNGTTPATANFSIRGLGINSSIPSIDPTVGVFVDGVYMGITAGVLFDDFDIEAVEVLRGPQGVLFGRNVTGGAVLVRTKGPSDKFEISGHAAAETGPNYITDASISGPLIPGVLSAKLAAYHNEDYGWFENKLDNARFGSGRQTVVRPALRWTPNAALDTTLRMEHGEVSGDGPPSQNHALFPRDSFDFSIDERGDAESKWNQAFLETNLDVSFGNGRVTNILGWREYESASRMDVDATPELSFHGVLIADQNQRSEELRYSGAFGPFQVTSGVYYFQQNLLYIERRLLAGGLVDRTGGGDGDFSNSGVFSAVDWAVTEQVTINVGARYTNEEKKARVSTVRAGGGSVTDRTIVPDLIDEESWSDFTPRVGMQWQPNSRSQLYGFWAKGFRGGGYNFRNTDPGVTPGPFDSEEQKSVEVGWKQDLADDRVRINFAAFHNKVDRIQREINTPGALGVTQIIRNVGDATLRGAELEGRVRVTSGLTLSLQAGYTDGKYDSVNFDLTGDGLINAADEALELPRLAPWTYGGSVDYQTGLGALGVLTSRMSFNHRDASFFTDNNRGTLNAADMLDLNVTLIPANTPVSLSLYATNLLDETTFGGDTQLPASPAFGAGPGRPSPTFSPLNKGRIVGAEVRVSF